MPKNLESIGSGAFANNNLKTVIILSNVKSIGEWAFYGNENLVIKGNKDSEAERYAQSEGFDFEILD